MIVANKWMRTNFGEPLRKWLKNKSIYQIIDFGDLPVFNNVTTYPCTLIIGKQEYNAKTQLTLFKTLNFSSLHDYIKDHSDLIDKSSFEDSGWNLASNYDQSLLKKLQSTGISFECYVSNKVYRGIVTGFNETFIIDEDTRIKLIRADKKSDEIIKPFLAGKDIKRYQLPKSNKFLIFTKRGVEIEDFPAIKCYLEDYKKFLIPKPQDFSGEKWEGRKPGKYKWYEIQDSIEYFREFEKSKIIYPNILKRPEFTFDTSGWYTNQKCFIIPTEDKYLLGLLNCKITHYMFDKLLPKLIGNFFEPNYVIFKNFPIKQIDQKNSTEMFLHDEIVKLVDELLLMYVEKNGLTLQTKVNQINSKIFYCEDRIDQIAFELYGLNGKVIDIIKTL